MEDRFAVPLTEEPGAAFPPHLSCKGWNLPGCYTSAQPYWGKHGAGSGAGHSRQHCTCQS